MPLYTVRGTETVYADDRAALARLVGETDAESAVETDPVSVPTDPVETDSVPDGAAAEAGADDGSGNFGGGGSAQDGIGSGDDDGSDGDNADPAGNALADDEGFPGPEPSEDDGA